MKRETTDVRHAVRRAPHQVRNNTERHHKEDERKMSPWQKHG